MTTTLVTKTSDLTHAPGLKGARKAVVAGVSGGVTGALAAAAGYLTSHGSVDTYGWLTIGGAFLISAITVAAGTWKTPNDLVPVQVITPAQPEGSVVVVDDTPGRHEASDVASAPLPPPEGGVPPPGAGDVP